MNLNFISLIPNLADIKGHQFAYHEAIQKELDLPFQAYLSKQHRIDRLPKGWIPFFSKKDNRKLSPLATLRRAWEFGKLFRKKETFPRVFFLESFNTSDLCAFYLAARFYLKKQDSLLLLFRYDLKKIQTALAKRLRATYLSDSAPIVEQFAQRGLKAHLLPIPHTETVDIKPTPNKEILCWWPGQPRPAKGKKEICALLKREKRNDFKILFSQELEIKSALIPYQHLPTPLLRKEYVHWLYKIDIVLLPYDPITYRSSTSGIFVETIIAGKVPLVKEGSWLSHELKKFDLHDLILDWSRPDFFSHAKYLLNSADIQKKLKKMQEAYLAYHSPKSFCHRLLKILL